MPTFGIFEASNSGAVITSSTKVQDTMASVTTNAAAAVRLIVHGNVNPAQLQSLTQTWARIYAAQKQGNTAEITRLGGSI